MKSLIRFLFLVAMVMAQVGCASATSQSSDDSPPDLTPVPSTDDSHGWGTSVQGVSH